MQGVDECLLAAAGRLALAIGFFAAPVWYARAAVPRAGLDAQLALAGLGLFAWNTLLLATLHVADVPIRREVLLGCYGLFALGGWCLQRLRVAPPPYPTALRALLPVLACFAVAVLPVTYLCGMDTYRWQNLATNIVMQERIPWLLGPEALAGFTHRAYPALHPFLLATAQSLGSCGVDAGFYVVSLITGWTGLAGMSWLARTAWPGTRAARWAPWLYASLPVFLRYTHWATGRGVLLAVLPVLLVALLRLRSPLGWAGWLATAALAVLAHKAGQVAALVLLPLALVGCLLPARLPRVLRLAAIAVLLLGGSLLAPRLLLPGIPGHLAGWLRYDLARFGVLALLGLAAWGLAARPALPRVLVLPWLATLAVAHTADMYGALLAAPLVALAAAAGLDTLLPPNRRTAVWGRYVLLAACILAAAATLARRLHTATPPRIRAAARFLNAHDPQGPYRIHAPGRARVQLEAYARGCPRMDVLTRANAPRAFQQLPSLRLPPRAAIDGWTRFLRAWVASEGEAYEWYGRNPREYFVTLDATPPQDLVVLYRQDGVIVTETRAQHTARTRGATP
jgi:hypothetical protein